MNVRIDKEYGKEIIRAVNVHRYCWGNGERGIAQIACRCGEWKGPYVDTGQYSCVQAFIEHQSKAVEQTVLTLVLQPILDDLNMSSAAAFLDGYCSDISQYGWDKSREVIRDVMRRAGK
jgi:hypothetical protein